MTQAENNDFETHADALKAMADGQDVEPSQQPHADPPPDGASSDGMPGDDNASGAADPADYAAPVFNADAAGTASKDKKLRQAAYHARSTRADSEQYKRTMIPLLVIVGGLLVLAGFGTLAMLIQQKRGGCVLGEGNLLLRYGAWFIVAAWILGAILFVGAWMFHRELSRNRTAGE